MNNDYILSRVPASSRSGFFSVTLIRIGGITALSQFMLGATLGHSMTFWQATLATLLGSLILEFTGLGLGIIGCREGLPTSLLSRWCGFGRFGSAIIGFAIAISSLGWFGVQNGVLAKSIEYMLAGKVGFGWCAAISGMIITALVAFGFRGLTWTAKIAVPLFFTVITCISFNVLYGHNVSDLINSSPVSNKIMTISSGATMVAGGYIVAALITPDISRYCKNTKHVFWMMTTSIIAGEFIINGLSILIAQTLDTDDVVSIMTTSAGFIGVISVILAVIKVNDINLYSVSLGLSNFLECLTGKKWNYTWITLFSGLVGTLFTITGILDSFIHFLIIIGILFPPVAGIMLIDYFVLKTNRQILDATRAEGRLPDDLSSPFINYASLIAWGGGVFAGVTIKFGISSLNSIIISGVLYLLLSILKDKFIRIY